MVVLWGAVMKNSRFWGVLRRGAGRGEHGRGYYGGGWIGGGREGVIEYRANGGGGGGGVQCGGVRILTASRRYRRFEEWVNVESSSKEWDL